MARAPVVLVALSLGACLEVPGPFCPENGDSDGDGWECFGPAGDCDDGDPGRYPGLFDICDDGIDQDCTGLDAVCTDQLEPVSLTGTELDTWQITTESTQVQLTAPDFLLSSLRLREDGEELLYTGPDPEQLFGLAIYPVFHVDDAVATPVVRTDGPARVEIEVTWDDEDSGFASGTSTFGFAPDGRIARRELIHANEYTHVSATMYFATFASFDSQEFSHVDWTTNPAPPLELALAPGSGLYRAPVTDLGWTCLSDLTSGRRIAMTWQRQPGAAGARVTRGTGAPPHIAFEYDWARDEDVIVEDDYVSATMFAPSILPTPADEPCDGLAAGAISSPAPLLFVTGSSGAGDSDGDGFVETDGVYEIVNAGGDDHVEVELGDGALDGGVTFRLVLEALDGITVWREGTRMLDGVDVLMQPTETGWLVYFPPGSLESDQALRFALPGGEP